MECYLGFLRVLVGMTESFVGEWTIRPFYELAHACPALIVAKGSVAVVREPPSAFQRDERWPMASDLLARRAQPDSPFSDGRRGDDRWLGRGDGLASYGRLAKAFDKTAHDLDEWNLPSVAKREQDRVRRRGFLRPLVLEWRASDGTSYRL